ncbi:MAG: Holliday junction branch migration protein RuvA [Patescibacteria group bacterium]
MIGWLSGTVVDKIGRYLILNVNGVGYRVTVLPDKLSQAVLGSPLKLFIHPHIKEDLFDLFGFETKKELSVFELLLTVSGIGPKTALAILAGMRVEEIISSISRGQPSDFSGISGLGTKGAQRVIVELRTKVGAVGDLDLSGADSKERDEIIQALRTFGFTDRECREALKKIPSDEGLTIEQKIKSALKNLGH